MLASYLPILLLFALATGFAVFTCRHAVVEVTSNLLSARPHTVARLWLRSQSSP